MMDKFLFKFMNLVFLFLSFFILIMLTILSFYLYYYYKNSLINIDIKEKGFIYFYQIHLDSLFRDHLSYKNWKIIFLFWLHYLLLHSFTPIFLISFLLKNDWNVLIAIITIIVSMNLFQKLYPSNIYLSPLE